MKFLKTETDQYINIDKVVKFYVIEACLTNNYLIAAYLEGEVLQEEVILKRYTSRDEAIKYLDELMEGTINACSKR